MLVFVIWCLRRLGEAPVRLLLTPITLYFFLFAPSARRASRDYLARVARVRGGDAQPPRPRDTYRHLYSFSETILDRFLLWSGKPDQFDLLLRGRESMKSYVEDGTGAFLVGAHLGNFDVLRVLARDADIPVNVLMFTANAERINQAIEALDPDSNVRVIDLRAGSASVAFDIRSCIERGEFVAALADRVLPGARERIGYADFLGSPAPFPHGPFLLSLVMRTPVVLTLAIRTGPRSYEVILESISEAETVAVCDRAAVLQQRIDTFAARLEYHCLRAPDQWFNFYDFWAGAESECD